MFILHQAYTIETLIDQLAAELSEKPLSSPLAPEWLLVQDLGVERWLSQQLAQRFAVFGNYRYLTPDVFVNRLAKRLIPEQSCQDFSQPVLLWRIESRLRQLDDAIFTPLQHYLNGEQGDVKRYQLATQLADLFQRYQALRPDWLAAWSNRQTLSQQPSEAWQARLWQDLCASSGDVSQPIVLQAALAKLRQTPHELLPPLPTRVSVFAVDDLSWMSVQCLQALALHCQVDCYVLLPLPDAALHHPLLSACAKQALRYQNRLRAVADVQQMMPDAVACDQFKTSLQHLQQDLLHNRTPSRVLADDGSIRVHACHSKLREIEVLKDQLLDAFECDADLQLRDVVVMAPDINDYAPFIKAVFDDIQHAIADQSLQRSNTALDTFSRFLDVSQSRFGWQAVLDMLEQPAVFPRFDLTADDLDLIRYWLMQTRVRWGQSAQHRQQLDLPPIAQNTWQASLERLFVGYAVGDDEAFVDGVLPFIHIEGHASEALGGLDDFMQLLFRAGRELKQPKTRVQWQSVLSEYADALLMDDNEQAKQGVFNVLATLQPDEAMNDAETLLSWQVIVAWLADCRREQAGMQGFLRGGLTFCSLPPSRPLPFKIIALLGMNDGAFPRDDTPLAFDLTTCAPQADDPSRRESDRYRFLQVLLAARQQLIISYVGQSLQNNQALPAAVVVSELLEVLQDDYQLPNLTVLHPLHGFSRRYFDTEQTALFSYNDHACQLAERLQTEKAAPVSWWQGQIIVPQQDVLELYELLSFFRHPQRHFLQRQLGLRFQGIADMPEEREPFAVKGLALYDIQQQWLEAALRDQDLSLERLQAEGRWLAAAPGHLTWQREQQELSLFAERIQAKDLGKAVPPQAVDITLGGYRIVGKLGNAYQHGSLLYRYASLKGKDFMSAWLQHLLWNQQQAHTTHLLSKNIDVLLTPTAARVDDLLCLLEWYRAGQSSPNVFFTEAALAYVQQCVKLSSSSRADKPAIAVAQDVLQQALERAYEPELQLLYHHETDWTRLLDQRFVALCEEVILPVWEEAVV